MRDGGEAGQEEEPRTLFGALKHAGLIGCYLLFE